MSMDTSNARPDGSLTPINYLDGKHAVRWAYYLASREDLLQAHRDLGLIPDQEMVAEHRAILSSAHRFRFGRFLPHV